MVKVYFIHFLLSFDELLELSQRGDNRTIDMLVGDIYGGMDYNKVYSLFVHSFHYSC
jgi:pantothenate kinase